MKQKIEKLLIELTANFGKFLEPEIFRITVNSIDNYIKTYFKNLSETDIEIIFSKINTAEYQIKSICTVDIMSCFRRYVNETNYQKYITQSGIDARRKALELKNIDIYESSIQAKAVRLRLETKDFSLPLSEFIEKNKNKLLKI